MRTYLRSLFLLSILGGVAGPGLAQSVTGTTSLITVPVAEMPADGTIAVGGGFLPRQHTTFKEGQYHVIPYFASITFLPFVELGFRFSKPLNPEAEVDQDLGDRMLIARLRIVPERKWRPAVVVGAHDFLQSSEAATKNFSALYVVASKHVPSIIPIGIHLGYGSDLLNARQHQFVGIFGGVSLTPLPYLDVLLEYDSESISAGARVTLFDHVQLLAGLQHLDAFTGGITVYTELP